MRNLVKQQLGLKDSKSDHRKLQGIVYILDGAGGSGFTPLVYSKSLQRLPYAVEHFRWGTGYGRLLSDLTNRANIEAKAEELSEAINRYRLGNEGHKIFVIAKSAGTAVALKALANLEPKTVDRVILLSPAVSPTFPLDPVLDSVRKDVVSFWSPNDHFYLGWGTSTFGTADGVFCKGAGLIGFDLSTTADGSKLRQVKWDPSMMLSLHFGDHSGNSMPPFVRKYVLPLLMED